MSKKITIGNKPLYLVIVLLLAVVSWLIYNQNITNGEQAKSEFLFEKRTECREMCEPLYEKYAADNQGWNVFRPEYGYNQELNSCFYSGGMTTTDTLEMQVSNCQTNNIVVSLFSYKGEVTDFSCDTCVTSRSQYDQRANKLLGK